MCSKNGGIFKSWEATVRKKQAAAKKRVLSNLFLTMSVASVEDDMSMSDSGVSAAGAGAGADTTERVLPNGDFYTGQCSSDNMPHGHGKYLWTDGCMYVGGWNRGRATGKGKFFWPTGATYEGDFKSGFMDGKGNYTEPSGNIYRGNWVMNLKQGQGTKNYLNGDYYQGDWKGGLQDGQGKYQWNNGNCYVGQWKEGKMNGTGTLTWTNGNRYEGLWEDGVPKGNGTFTNAAGGSYVGVWSKDLEELSVTYQPAISESSSSSENINIDNNNMEGWEPQQLYDVELQSCNISPAGEKQQLLLSQKMPTWPADLDVSRRPRRTRTTQEGRLSNFSADSDNSVTIDNAMEDISTRIAVARQFLRVRPAKTQGETIAKGHKNYELMLNLQLGIRHSVGKHPPPKSLELKSSSFDPKEKVWTKFPPEGTKSTPPHQSCEFRWKDYCPLVFRTLRLLFKVDPADYMLSICGNEALRELSSPGKSGSFFYMTSDDRYMIKTVKKAEVKVLIRMLKEYYHHVRSFDNTLVTKFYGLHCVKLPGPSQKKVRFVIMGNLFDSGYAIHRRFDLKGSSHGRITDKPESEIDANTTLKDLDLNFIFRLQQSRFQELCKQVDKDCEFLEKARIMDYSLLVGLHYRKVTYNSDTQINEACPCTGIIDNNDSDGSSSPCLSSSDPEQSPSTFPRWEMKMGLNMPARAELTVRRSDGECQLVGEPTGELYQVILTFGIIDILQDYDITKKLEHAYKSIQYDPTSISAVDPKQYSKRFRDFIYRVFVEDTC